MQRCAQAAEVCAAACDAALAADDSYTRPGTEPYAAGHLALVSCGAVCSLVVAAVREGDGDLELLRWCAETCSQCASGERPEHMPPAAWSLVTRACMRCAIACQAVVDHVAHFARQAIEASRDTDFHNLEA